LEAKGDHNYKIIDRKPFVFHNSMMVPKNSPFTRMFNEIISRIVESGVIWYYLDLAISPYEKNLVKIRADMNSVDLLHVLDIEDLTPLFLFYIKCNAFSFIIFIVEFFWVKLQVYWKKFRTGRLGDLHQSTDI
jgi:hypothetical protein